MTVKVGDKIRITGAFDTSDLYENGDILTVADFDSDGDVYVRFAGYGEKLICAREFEVISNDTDAKLAELEERIAALEAAQPSAQQAPATLKVGNYAKVVDEIHGHNFEIGSIINLKSQDEDGAFRATDLSGNQSWYVESPELVIATDEEVAEAKRQAEKDKPDRAIAAKFAEIGRKPGEVKVGDIVDRGNGYLDIVANTQGRRFLDYPEKLVVPVERRFDR